MMIPHYASGRLVLPGIIPVTAFVGSINVEVENNRQFKGASISFTLSAVVGAGQLRLRVESMNGGIANSLVSTAYTSTVGLSQTHVLYPGVTFGSGVTHYSAILPESFRIFLENISAIPGNEVTANCNVTLLE